MGLGIKSDGSDEGGCSSISTRRGREGLPAENNSTTAVCPQDAANSEAVSPLRAGMSGLTSSRSNSNFTTASYPFSAAQESGV